ncbi:hypothetical protein J1N35_012049 [Gossypium stocksii]|uniref:Aminotransferase-like plant mobile domain-containing protein n=1 Tax=Gossypium stocksii TaxID=47602 RepID=A0A9D3W3I5_9ROSI|nr:hypothetical protein J1N35_012049 [Gossypium stocksii]
MLRDFKLDPTFISVLVERWRPEIHAFHFPCGECTITLEDVALQLGLPIDRLVITRTTIVPSKKDICEAFLGKVSTKFQSARIDMKWLENNFKELPKDATDVVKEQFA